MSFGTLVSFTPAWALTPLSALTLCGFASLFIALLCLVVWMGDGDRMVWVGSSNQSFPAERRPASSSSIAAFFASLVLCGLADRLQGRVDWEGVYVSGTSVTGSRTAESTACEPNKWVTLENCMCCTCPKIQPGLFQWSFPMAYITSLTCTWSSHLPLSFRPFSCVKDLRCRVMCK